MGHLNRQAAAPFGGVGNRWTRKLLSCLCQLELLDDTGQCIATFRQLGILPAKTALTINDTADADWVGLIILTALVSYQQHQRRHGLGAASAGGAGNTD